MRLLIYLSNNLCENGFKQDYEYASYNPIAYDIANHFCEMAADYHSNTPHILDYTLYPGTVMKSSSVYNSIVEKPSFFRFNYGLGNCRGRRKEEIHM